MIDTAEKYDRIKKVVAATGEIASLKAMHGFVLETKKQACLAKDRKLFVDATIVRTRIERRIGEVMAQRHLRQKDVCEQDGIPKRMACRCLMFLCIPEEEFNKALLRHRQKRQPVLIAAMEELAGGRRAKHHYKPQKNKRPVSNAHHYCGFAIRQLERIECNDPSAKTELGKVATWITERQARL